jgi:hypothetical protein
MTVAGRFYFRKIERRNDSTTEMIRQVTSGK